MRPWAGYVTSSTYMLVQEVAGRFHWAVFTADQFVGRVHWGNCLDRGHSITPTMAHSAGRTCALRHLQHRRQIMRVTPF